MQVTVVAEASQIHRTFTYDPTDYGYTEEEFNELSEKERKSILQSWVDDEPEQPYWVI